MNTLVIKELIDLMTTALNDNKHVRWVSDEKVYYISSCEVPLSFEELHAVCNELKETDEFKALEPRLKAYFTLECNRMGRRL